MLKSPSFRSSQYSLTSFLNLHSTTRRLFRRHYQPSISPGFPSPRSSSSFTHTTRKVKMESESYTFGPYKINSKEVFYSTQFSYALVNLRPLVPGHVLVCPRREVQRFLDLTADETSDLWLSAQKIGRQLESYHKASSLTFAIQVTCFQRRLFIVGFQITCD